LKETVQEQVDNLQVWQDFATAYNLSLRQLDQFKCYAELLQAWNAAMNLTTVETTASIITHHFQDSLALAQAVTLKEGAMLADVGSGAGFPGIPLKICYPHLNVLLIEVLAKRGEFLRAVIDELGLENIEISDLDWRTFLRKTTYTIDYVCARASLRPDELVRMFKPSCRYRTAQLFYWASASWALGSVETPFFVKEVPYQIEHKHRRIIVFAYMLG
jgi:16S rRNA (guanine(527)-N(7))-methyltransferase RsmG